MEDSLCTTLEFDVHGFDCGYGGPLRAFALANFLQEAAGANAERLGFGMGDLRAKGWTWMLSRLDLRVDDLPREGERVSVRTWPAGTRKLFALRDFAMIAPDGRSLVRAVYAYLIVDIAARRPLRPASVFGSEPPATVEPHSVADFDFGIPAASDSETSFEQSVRPRHIDHNGHANNAYLLDWLVDASAQEGHAEPPRAFSALKVEFLAEALEGDRLIARRGAAERGNTEPLPSDLDVAAISTVAELFRGDAKVARALVETK